MHDERQRLEQLCRYITRPALANERVQINAAGQVELGYELAPFGIQVKVIALGRVATDFASRSLAHIFDGDGGAYVPTVAKVTGILNERRGNYASSASKTLFLAKSTFVHGSATLRADRNPRGAEENWRAVLAFLARFKPKP